MKKLLLGMMFLSSLSVNAGDEGVIERIGDVVFAPIKVENYGLEQDTEGKLVRTKFYSSVALGLGWLADRIVSDTEMHKSIVNQSALITNKEAALLSNADVDKIMAQVGDKGVQGGERIYLYLESREQQYIRENRLSNDAGKGYVYVDSAEQQVKYGTRQTNSIDTGSNRTLTSSTASEIATELNPSQATDAQMRAANRVLVKDITREELEKTLQTLSNNNVRAFSVKTATLKTSAARVGSSALVVYLTLDFLHTLEYNDY